MIGSVRALAVAIASLALAPPPAWIQRVVPPPIVAWREADVLGTPIVEGIAIDRDLKQLTVNVVDSRYDPPQIVRQRDLPGTRVRWLRAGRRDGLARAEIAVDVIRAGGDTAYLLLVHGGSTLQLVKVTRGAKLSPAVFAK